MLNHFLCNILCPTSSLLHYFVNENLTNPHKYGRLTKVYGVVLMKKYLLAIERRPHDYIPLSWNLSIVNNCQDITSLEEIDKLTGSIAEDELKTQFLSENIISEDVIDKPFVIIFEENGKTRKLSSGIVTNEEKESLAITSLNDFLINNIRRRQLMNRIYNKFKDKDISPALKVILENINGFQKDTIFRFMDSLNMMSQIPYEELRELALFIKRDLEVLLEKEEERILAIKNKKVA